MKSIPNRLSNITNTPNLEKYTIKNSKDCIESKSNIWTIVINVRYFREKCSEPTIKKREKR